MVKPQIPSSPNAAPDFFKVASLFIGSFAFQNSKIIGECQSGRSLPLLPLWVCFLSILGRSVHWFGGERRERKREREVEAVWLLVGRLALSFWGWCVACFLVVARFSAVGRLWSRRLTGGCVACGWSVEAAFV
jgi:hypothetical protein